MSNNANSHKTALVPMEVWHYGSPALVKSHKRVDIGLLAEALIYYENILFIINTPEEFEELISWFSSQGKIDLLFELLKNKTIRPFYYHFMTTTINKDGIFSVWNIDSPHINNQSNFIRLVLYRANLNKFMNSRKRSRLYRIIEESLIDESVDGYDSPVEDSRITLKQVERVDLVTQAFVDHIYKELAPSLKPPNVKATIIDADKDKYTINYNIDFHELDQIIGIPGYFRSDMPVIGEVNSNRLIWTASKYGYDLYLGDVMSTIVGNKLLEIDKSFNKSQKCITKLTEKIEFPDIRRLTNQRLVDIDLIMKVRKNGSGFRQWLQEGSEKNRDEIIAYHHEVAKTSGFTKHISSTLKIFGYLTQYGLPILEIANPTAQSPFIATAENIAGTFIKSIGETVSQSWKPVVFGDWVTKEVDKKIRL